MHDEPRKSNFSTPGFHGRVDHVRLDRQVLVQEIGRVGVVGEDSADLRRGQEDRLRAVRPRPALDVLPAGRDRAPPGSAVRISQSSEASRRTIADPVHAAMAGDPDALALAETSAQSWSCHARRYSRSTSTRSACDHLSDTSSETLILCVQPSFVRAFVAIAEQQVHFGRAEIARIDFDQHLARLRVLRPSRPPPCPRHTIERSDLARMRARRTHAPCGSRRSRARNRRDSGRCSMQPHAFDEIARMTPVALGFEVADVELSLAPERDRRDSASDLSGNERLAACRTLVVEENPVAGVAGRRPRGSSP